MGRNRPQTPIFVQDIVVKSRSFPLFPPSFQHSTSVLHMPRGKKAHTPPFHNSSTAPSPKQRPQKIRMAAKRRRVFNTLPSPYYCYYNKYNKTQGKKPCIQQQTMRTLWGKRIRQPSGSGLRTESGQRSGRKERKIDPPPCVRFCQLHRGNSGRSPDRSPLPRPRGTRSGPSLLRSGSKASRRALPAAVPCPIPSRPGAQKPFWTIHKNWKSSGGGWKMRPAKMEIRPGLSANFQPGSRHRKHPRKLPAGREKRPFCCVYKYSKYCEYRCGAPQAVRRKPPRKKEQTLDKKEIDHFEYHL